MQHWLVNGERADSVPITDRGLSYADGLFETIAVRNGAPRFAAYHLERLQAGCSRLAIPMPDESRLVKEIEVVRGSRPHGTVKILVTRGSGPRGYAPPSHPRPTCIVGFMPATPDEPTGCRQGVAVRFCQTVLGHSPALAGLKTLGRLEHVLARAEWRDPGIAEGLMRDPEGKVVCGTMSNVFAVSMGRLITPDLTQCGVRGVMRRVVMELAKQLGLEVRETALSGSDIRKANELFVTNALIGLWAVSRCEQRCYEIGPVTVALCRALAGAGVDECRA